MKPVIPMEPKPSADPPVGDGWIAQVKWDGVRMLVYRTPDQVQVFNRRQRNRTWHYPELLQAEAYCRARSFILDGEVVALGPDGRPDFHEVMRRDGVRRPERVAALQRAVPVFYMVFDILFCDGRWVTDRPLGERSALLDEVLTPTDLVRRVDPHDDPRALFERTGELGLEGIVCKRLDAPYLPGVKSDLWRKVKHIHDLTAVVGGYTMGEEGGMGAILLGVFRPDGRLWYIGHCGSGRLAAAEWRALHAALERNRIEACPFANRPERSARAVWVGPRVTVRIAYAEWPPGRSLRHPVLQAVVRAAPQTCVWPQDVPGPAG
ncbi:ATP-dependent DNA ligase [Alicyclobacillus sp.]|uniref:ATP-dependent DNA ligase n=1 Tax=Alicyclobacillus sp. TaxID=61169 RepID=UPI0025C30B7E|nr:RNA ligase family protein [Alicyclobacillus sp.]MCL6517687.1 DNA ligase [Alicyclobacillus sp.]